MTRVRFRHSAAIAVAGLVAFLGAVPLATANVYLAPILLVPLAVLGWAWRAGTDADGEGLAVRALLGRRRIPWAQVAGFVPVGRRVVVRLAGGATVALPAVTPADLPRLLQAGGQDLIGAVPADRG